MQIGDLDVVNTILTLQNKVMVMEEVLGYIMQKNPNLEKPNQKTIEQMEAGALKKLQELYPNMGIQKK